QREKSGARAERSEKFRRLLEERRDAARTILKERQRRVEGGKIEDGLVEAASMVLEAELALAEKAAGRGALLRGVLDRVKKAEEEARAQHEAGRIGPLGLLNARAVRLEAEINLVRAQRAAK